MSLSTVGLSVSLNVGFVNLLAMCLMHRPAVGFSEVVNLLV